MNSEPDPMMRQPAVAGTFYPAEPNGLWSEAESCITRGTSGWRPEGSVPRAIISPHAGYRFSGWLAGAAWRATARGRPSTIVILSPSHAHAFEGIALPSQKGYAMPGFDVMIDRAAANSLVQAELAHVEDAAHDREHGIETQLAFLHRLHPRAKVVPLVIGNAPQDQVSAAIDHLSALDQPLFVLSSDLSHFLPREAADAKDTETAKLLETSKGKMLTSRHACGATAITEFLASTTGAGLRVARLAMASSADVTGDTSRTVGYGAWALFDTTDEIIIPRHRQMLLRAARQTLDSFTKRGKPPKLDETSFPQTLRGHGTSFITLQQDGRLRGCIGSLSAHQPLVRDVSDNTVKAASADPRFKPVTAEEVPDLRLKIAVLSPSAPMTFSGESDLLPQLTPYRDGLILRDGAKRGVFLPMVWDSLSDPVEFLTALKVKAGLPKDHWSDTLEIHRFCAESFAEPD
ncbi:MAG: AmmeMemoRadiSam system protein B [Roseovarius confluentis]|jgi:AmmeMemoRadiSam system protein B/AmmeMemoRadiSam system protein A